MKPENILEIQNNDLLKKRLAKYIALYCFRHTELENLHAGKVPQSNTGDYSDVKVVTPEGEIPWNKLSRLSDPEMKVLMIDVVNQSYNMLVTLFNGPAGDKIVEMLKKEDYCPEWNEPELRQGFAKYL